MFTAWSMPLVRRFKLVAKSFLNERKKEKKRGEGPEEKHRQEVDF